MPSLQSSQSLWDFALAFYAQPQVANTCVQMQDNYHLNVCLLIGLGWLDAQEQHLTEIDLVNLQRHIQGWTQQVVTPLRELRRFLKLPIEKYAQDDIQEKLRALIKQAELLAEKKLLMEIESWLTQRATTSISHGANSERYMLSLGIEQAFIELIQKSFPKK